MKQKNFLKIFFFSLIIYLFFLCFVYSVNAEVRINEIYPAPKSPDTTEWVELYNDENKQIDLSTYSLADENAEKTEQQIKITATSIEPYKFIIVETSSVLNNSGDTIYLKNNSVEIEQISYTGTFDDKKSFVRCMDGSDSWFVSTTQTKQISNNDICTTLLTPTPTNTPTITPSPTTTAQLTSIPAPTITPMSYGNIFISEVMPHPDENISEWIELYNNNDFTVSLDNWYIDDGENTGSSPKLFSISIPSKQYAVIDVSLFNNDGDTVRLLDFNKIEKDSFSYTYTTKGITSGRTSFSSNDFCEQDQTKGMPNNPCRVNGSEKSPSPTPSSPTPSPTATNTPTPKEVLISKTPFSFSQSHIIVDSHATTTGTDTLLFSDTPSLPSQQQGSVLSAETHRDHTTAKAYVFGLSSSSALISLFNIGNIIRKIIQRLKFNSD